LEDSPMPEALLIVLGAFLVYLFGRWQGEHQLLYQRRVEIIGKLFDHFEDVDQKFHSLFHPYGGGQPEEAKQAAESFNVLQGYYRRNSIWLPPRVSKQFGDFLARYRNPFNEFTSAVISRDYQPGYAEKWNEVWTAFEKDSPEIRQTLETEFRAALGSWRAKLAILLQYISAPRQDQKSRTETSRP
jgi:hypothetical protein